LIEEGITAQAPQPWCRPEEWLPPGPAEADSKAICWEAVGWYATEESVDGQVGEMRYDLAGFVAKAISA
jgi:hypothetical protein